MNDIKKRAVRVCPRLNRFMAIVVLSVTATNTGCSVVDQFTSDKSSCCSCGENSCGESLACCNTTGIGSSSHIAYPKDLPTVDPHAPPGLQTQAGLWAPRHNVRQPTGYPSCETQLQEAREDFDNKLASLESRFEEGRRANDAMNGQLQTLHGNVEQLSDDVDYWKDEVRRIDRTAEMHHRSDMENLHSISKVIDELSLEAGSASGKQIPDTRTR
ncbi:MAG: hypothetical protein P8J37_08305 [Fuerstiella sp.]|nr:hypothetical protein [Fuerstiella sp.]